MFRTRTTRRGGGFCQILQKASLYSDALDQSVSMRLSTNGIRTIEQKGGLDSWLNATPARKLPTDLRRLKEAIGQGARPSLTRPRLVSVQIARHMAGFLIRHVRS